MHQHLLEDIGRAVSKAAFFRKVDLHVHSYDSHDFPSLSDKEGAVMELRAEDNVDHPAAFISQIPTRERPLDIVAITDHNRCRTACAIARLGDNPVMFIPGMEITARCSSIGVEHIHVVGLFPPGTASETIDRIFMNSGMPAYDDRDERSMVLHVTVGQLIQAIHQVGGLCIAAHVNTDSGAREYLRASNVRRLQYLREIERLRGVGDPTDADEKRLAELDGLLSLRENELQDRFLLFIAEAGFDAIEIQKPDDVQHYSSAHCAPLGLPPVACLLSSDAHCARDVGLRGHTTYLKMAIPGFDGIRKALLDPETRIRYEEEATIPAVIAGVSFRPMEEEATGFFRDCTVGFSDNLTCLIGGRGAGKSAVIDALRFVFMLPTDAIAVERLRDDVQSRQDQTLSGLEVRTIMRPSGQDPVVLAREYTGTDSPATRCYSLNGQELDIDVATSKFTRVRLYGWSEIEALAKNPRQQRDLLDGFVGEMSTLRFAVEYELTSMGVAIDDIVSKVSEVRNLQPLITALPDLRRELDSLNTDEMRTIFEDTDRASDLLDDLRQTSTALQQLFGTMEYEPEDGCTLGEKVTELLNPLCSETAQQVLGPGSILPQGEIAAIAERLQERYQALQDVSAEILQLVGGKEGGVEAALSTARSALVERAKSVYSDDLSDEDILEKVEARTELAEQVSQLEVNKERIDSLTREVEEELGRLMRAEEVAAARKEVYTKRSAKVEEINRILEGIGDKVTVAVELEEAADRQALVGRLRNPSERGDALFRNLPAQWSQRMFPEQIARAMPPDVFVRAVLRHDVAALALPQYGDFVGITRDQAEKIIEHLSPMGDDGWYDPDRLERILSVLQVPVDDMPVISLSGRPIEQLSPGQRCTALLPIILMEGSSPLVIDQPEDNLDNSLVFDVVVEVIRSLKERRQLVVATHNPNIPVSGDAEQIVVLEALSDTQGRPRVQGSIDCPEIVREVTEIMEGGREAFELRAKKYGYRDLSHD